MDKRLKVVEFFGVPGAGKSYLVNKIVPADIERPLGLYNDRCIVIRIGRKVLLMLRHLPSFFKTALWSIKLLSHYSPINWRRRVKVIFNWVFIDCVVRDVLRRRSLVMVLDQGIAHALWSTQFRAEANCTTAEIYTLLRQFLENISVCDWTIVHVTAPYDVVLQRIESREGLSPVDKDIAGLKEAFSAESRAAKVIEDMCDAYEDNPNLQVVRFDNSGELDFALSNELWEIISDNL